MWAWISWRFSGIFFCANAGGNSDSFVSTSAVTGCTVIMLRGVFFLISFFIIFFAFFHLPDSHKRPVRWRNCALFFGDQFAVVRFRLELWM